MFSEILEELPLIHAIFPSTFMWKLQMRCYVVCKLLIRQIIELKVAYSRKKSPYKEEGKRKKNPHYSV